MAKLIANKTRVFTSFDFDHDSDLRTMVNRAWKTCPSKLSIGQLRSRWQATGKKKFARAFDKSIRLPSFAESIPIPPLGWRQN